MQKQGGEVYHITILREPVERLVSEYCHLFRLKSLHPKSEWTAWNDGLDHRNNKPNIPSDHPCGQAGHQVPGPKRCRLRPLLDKQGRVMKCEDLLEAATNLMHRSEADAHEQADSLTEILTDSLNNFLECKDNPSMNRQVRGVMIVVQIGWR